MRLVVFMRTTVTTQPSPAAPGRPVPDRDVAASTRIGPGRCHSVLVRAWRLRDHRGKRGWRGAAGRLRTGIEPHPDARHTAEAPYFGASTGAYQTSIALRARTMLLSSASAQPGGTRAILEMYRARQTDAEQNRPHYADPITCPVLAVGAQAYLGDAVATQLTQVARDARDARGTVIPAAGHNIALENPAALAHAYLDFFAAG